MEQEPTLRLRTDDVAWRQFGEEVILLDLRSSTYLAANPTASILWRLLEEGTTEAALVDALRQEFDVDEARARADVEHFLATCRERELLGASR